MRISDWSSDVCSSDLIDVADAELYGHTAHLSDIETPEAALLTEEIRDAVVDTISKLPPDLRKAITLRELEGLSYEERSEEHTSELQSLMRISYAVFCLKKKKTKKNNEQSYCNYIINAN